MGCHVELGTVWGGNGSLLSRELPHQLTECMYRLLSTPLVVEEISNVFISKRPGRVGKAARRIQDRGCPLYAGGSPEQSSSSDIFDRRIPTEAAGGYDSEWGRVRVGACVLFLVSVEECDVNIIKLQSVFGVSHFPCWSRLGGNEALRLLSSLGFASTYLLEPGGLGVALSFPPSTISQTLSPSNARTQVSAAKPT